MSREAMEAFDWIVRQAWSTSPTMPDGMDEKAEIVRAALAEACTYPDCKCPIDKGEACAMGKAEAPRAESAGAEPVAPQATFDCRLCKHFTTKSGGCTSTVLCVDARQFQPTTPRRYWQSAAARGKG